MKAKTLRVFPCSYSRPCSNYQCRKLTKGKMWFIGIPQNLASTTIYCDNCVRSMVANLPDELKFDDKEALDAAIVKETAPLIQTIAEKDKEIEFLMEQLASAEVGGEDNVTPEPDIGDPEPEEESEQVEESEPEEVVNQEEEGPFRCLDCGKDFDTEVGLKAHRGKMHKGE